MGPWYPSGRTPLTPRTHLLRASGKEGGKKAGGGGQNIWHYGAAFLPLLDLQHFTVSKHGLLVPGQIPRQDSFSHCFETYILLHLRACRAIPSPHTPCFGTWNQDIHCHASQ